MNINVQLTQEGLENLQKELLELQSIKRPQAVERLSKARAMGDLSENSEYTSAKEDLGVVEGRIRELQELIKHAIVISTSGKSDEIKLGSQVTVDIEGTIKEFMIVGEFEADPMSNKLSATSPIGKALIGNKVGKKVVVNAPAGDIVYKILSFK